MVVKDLKFDSTQIIQKYCLFLLKFDHFHYPAIFQCQKAEMIKLWLNSIIWSHECASNPIIRCVEVTHWLKKYVGILKEFSIFLTGFRPYCFAIGSYENYLKQSTDLLFDKFCWRTYYQYIHRCIRKHDGVLFKKCKLRHCFLVKQWKEASELKSIYRFKLFIIYAKHDIYRVQT